MIPRSNLDTALIVFPRHTILKSSNDEQEPFRPRILWPDRDHPSAIVITDPRLRFSERPGYPYHGWESGGRSPRLINGTVFIR
jgi:hypothetical protein